MAESWVQFIDTELILFFISAIMWFGSVTYHLFAREGLEKKLADKIIEVMVVLVVTNISWMIYKITCL